MEETLSGKDKIFGGLGKTVPTLGQCAALPDCVQGGGGCGEGRRWKSRGLVEKGVVESV